MPPIAPAISLEAYEAELRTVYPFINDGKFKLDIEQPQQYLQNLNFCHFNPMIKKLYSVVNTIDDTLKLTATCVSYSKTYCFKLACTRHIMMNIQLLVNKELTVFQAFTSSGKHARSAFSNLLVSLGKMFVKI